MATNFIIHSRSIRTQRFIFAVFYKINAKQSTQTCTFARNSIQLVKRKTQKHVLHFNVHSCYDKSKSQTTRVQIFPRTCPTIRCTGVDRKRGFARMENKILFSLACCRFGCSLDDKKKSLPGIGNSVPYFYLHRYEPPCFVENLKGGWKIFL